MISNFQCSRLAAIRKFALCTTLPLGLALGYVRSVSPNVNLSLGGAYSSGEATANVGVGFGW